MDTRKAQEAGSAELRLVWVRKNITESCGNYTNTEATNVPKRSTAGLVVVASERRKAATELRALRRNIGHIHPLIQQETCDTELHELHSRPERRA